MRRTTKENLQAILGITLFIALLMVCGRIENYYTRKDCVVSEVNNTEVTVIDKSGYEWVYFTDNKDESPCVGTVVDLKMFTNCTDNNIYDDEIIKVVIK